MQFHRRRVPRAFKSLALLLFLSLLAVPALAQELPTGIQKIVEYNQQLVQSITLLGAFLGGLISFLSPCGFVLLPMFFTVAFQQKKALRASLMFGLGLMATFTVFGFIAGTFGTLFNAYREPFALVSGLLIAFTGLWLLLGKAFPAPRHAPFKVEGLASMFFLGAFFGVGWTPCVGSVLAAILLVAGNLASPLWGALLLMAFSLGVITPLVAATLLLERKSFAAFCAAVNKPFSLPKVLGRQLSLSPYNLVAGLFLLAIGLTIAAYGGTTPFMETIQQFTSWDMRLWADLNNWLMKPRTG